MKRLYLLLGTLVVLCGALMAGACMSRAAQTKQGFTLVWNYDTSGYMETCGCSSHQLGGLPRRATLLGQLRAKQPVLAIEGAHVVEDKGDFQLFKGEMIMRLLSQMGYNGAMLGVREAQQGVDGIAKLKAAAQFPLFSSNLMAGDKPAVEVGITADVGGNHVYIVAASQPEAVSFELPAGISFADPWPALDKALAVKPKPTDLTVICLEGETTWIERTVEHYKGQADLFLSGDRSLPTPDLDFHGDPPRINNVELGKYASVLTVDPAQQGYTISGENVPLQDTLADEPAVRAVLDTDYKTQLKDRFFGSMKEQLGKLYMPPDSCSYCHKDAYDVYLKSGHAHALKTLEDKGQLYNPDCMKCHVSYDSGTDVLVSMDCTTCHSNITEDHVWDANKDPQLIKQPAPPVTTYTYAYCSRCHDPANSARFKDHWPQMVHHIAHGGDLAAAKQAAIDLGIDLNAEPPPH